MPDRGALNPAPDSRFPFKTELPKGWLIPTGVLLWGLLKTPPPRFPALHQPGRTPPGPQRRASLARWPAPPSAPCAPLPARRARGPRPAHPGPRPPRRSGRCCAVCAGPQCGCAHWVASGAGRAATAAAAAAAGLGASGGGGVGSGVERSLGLQQHGNPGVESPGDKEGKPGRQIPEQPSFLDFGGSLPPHFVFKRPHLTPQQPRPLTGGGGSGGLRGAAMPLPR
ncbi:translation initiation factor IF-2 [Pongo abelii]|uniref:translation initiation factor IF-2 n=1 Tax=Pongo abelii TaxID=9601 RepID=UPI0030042B74